MRMIIVIIQHKLKPSLLNIYCSIIVNLRREFFLPVVDSENLNTVPL